MWVLSQVPMPMSRVFFAKSNAERQRAKRALQREKNLAAAIKSSDDDDTSVNEMDVPLAYPLSMDDQLSSHDLFQKDDLASQQQNNITFAESTSNDDDDDDADLDELIRASDVNYERKVYTDSFLSIHNACEIIIKLARRLNLDKNKTRILLQGIRSLLPQNNKLPKTIVGLMKILGMNISKKVVYYCAECLTCLKTPQQMPCSHNCALNNNYPPFSKVSELTINNIKDEIRCTIEKYGNVIIDYPNRSKLSLPCDVPNADVYQNLSSTTSIKNGQKQITVMLHTDGAPVTKMGGKSLWPIQATICEIPPPLRDHKQATMIFGAWLGSHHPDRNLLWGNIVKQLKELFTEEIKVAINKQQFKFIVRVQLVTFDLPALALNCNIIQFNGYNACPYCKITGKAIEKQVFYPHSPDQYPPKTIDDYRRYGVSNSLNITTIGIKGPTPLTDILLFPVQISIDYMHLICSGHVKTLIGYWHKMLLPRVFMEASDYLISIVLPHCFNYQFMSLMDYNHWKTKLFRLVFFSLYLVIY
ncbi:unnamed protein product [Didymodactylos carnosus]|uniref:Transposase n=1 Tax=Didymodactylos carnosus TaxID=1234261 RepID=A0A8S2RWN3_9BILA|nr:unnamed protein product [Didymodactylos carnosus]CAF4193267.1 unnamed protein product [Didymodactylos carnosus]